MTDSGDSSDALLVAQLLRLVFQALFESLDELGIPGERLKQQMLKHTQKRRKDAIARGESVEVYSLAEGAIAVDPEMEDLLVRMFKKHRPPN